MEKTMRWWSDCTSNWREKYTKVRGERNKTREESRQLRAKLETAVKECTTLKRKHQEMKQQCDTLKSEIEKQPSSSVTNQPTTPGNVTLGSETTPLGSQALSTRTDCLQTTHCHTGGSSTISSSCGGDSIRSSTDNLVSGGEDLASIGLAQGPTTTHTDSSPSADFVDQLLSKHSPDSVNHIQNNGAETMLDNKDSEKQVIQDLQSRLKNTVEMLNKEKQ